MGGTEDGKGKEQDLEEEEEAVMVVVAMEDTGKPVRGP